jgi:hypothetical protein
MCKVGGTGFQRHKQPNIFSAFILIDLKNANILMFQTCSTNFTHIFGVLNCLFFNNFFLSIFKANESNLLTRHKKHVETGMSPNFDNDPYAMMICFQKNI